MERIAAAASLLRLLFLQRAVISMRDSVCVRAECKKPQVVIADVYRTTAPKSANYGVIFD
jgi:hypothetical protein